MPLVKRTSEYGFILFSVIWIFAISVDYINKHPFYSFAYEYFRYANLSLFVIVFTSILSYIISKYPIAKRIAFTWPFLLLVFLVFQIALCISYSTYMTVAIGALSILSLSAFLYGDLIKIKSVKAVVYKIGLGLIILSFLVYIAAALGLYSFWTAVLILALPFVLSFRAIPDLLKSLLVREHKIKGINYLGLFSISLILLFLGLNFAYSQSPFPIGFDSRNFYMNIARQVSMSEALIYGYRPYSWALIMSLGYTVFNSSAVAVSISFYGYILALFVMYRLATKGIKLGVNKSLFAMLILTVSPAITNQLYIEHKTDLGLLFFQLLAVLYFVSIFKMKSFAKVWKSKEYIVKELKSQWPKLLVLGLFLGFGLSIKMTNLFLVFSLFLCLIWLVGESFKLVIGSFLLTITIFYFAGLDDLSGLQKYHLGLSSIILVAFLVGIGLIVYSFIKSRIKTINSIVLVGLIGLFSLVPLAPWLVKNIIETGSLRPSSILNGAKPGPNLDFKTIDENYKNYSGDE